ncbi:MAG TPA: sulfotransferase, partial [Anaerolineales bacterium]|nr:sulfotransferase [Anaerolineales bacterium]
MNLRVIGAGLPRTGTHSLKLALEHLLGGDCYHMREIPGHPFDLGPGWDQALTGGTPDWDVLLSGYIATVDWPASMFWRELGEANPDA